MTSEEQKERVRTYYRETRLDYERFWASSRTLSLHYGYHERPGTPHSEAVINMIKKLATAAYISSSDYVLDAGCGIGGSANWLAEHKGCRVDGINISEDQLEIAREHAYPGVFFYNMDYLNTGFPDETFDVVWALESMCYAQNKADFVGEAYRLLKPNGRIAVADGFSAEPDAHILEGWAVPNLASVDQFHQMLEVQGFYNIYFENITQNVMPSSRRMHMAALSVYPIHKISRPLHARTEAQYGNVETAKEQYGLLLRGEFKYCVFVGVKPW